MPDNTGQHEVVENFAQNGPLAPQSGMQKGGRISRARNDKSWYVEVRPPLWKIAPAKLWFGKIGDYIRAQHIADIVLLYTGSPPYHFKNANLQLPALQCIGTSEPLTSSEMRLKYVQSIAGNDFEAERKDFIKKVTEVVRNRFPDLADAANTTTEPARNIDGDGQADQDEAPMEIDSSTCDAILESSRLSSYAYVPGFEIRSNGSKNTLQSVEQSPGAGCSRSSENNQEHTTPGPIIEFVNSLFADDEPQILTEREEAHNYILFILDVEEDRRIDEMMDPLVTFPNIEGGFRNNLYSSREQHQVEPWSFQTESDENLISLPSIL